MSEEENFQPSYMDVHRELCCVCHYCDNLVQSSVQGMPIMGCGEVTDEDKYARVAHWDIVKNMRKEGNDAAWNLVGCGKFESSGLPAHPRARKEMEQYNSKAERIPVDPEATEGGWDFLKKMEK
ncbi:MAG: hypothetical protein ABEK36_01480 [Candidatus Aenigmatarchaeota archaeon]